MRKLTTLATAAIAALALLAVAAAPANADRPFEITDPYGTPCDEMPGGVCNDTGYQGTFNLGSAAGATCTASFDMQVAVNGALETYNTQVDCDSPSIPNIAWECASDPDWNGQIRVPDVGRPQIDLAACLDYYPFGTYNHNITVEVTSNNPRRWQQLGTGTTNAPVPINNAYFGDDYQDDNITANLL